LAQDCLLELCLGTPLCSLLLTKSVVAMMSRTAIALLLAAPAGAVVLRGGETEQMRPEVVASTLAHVQDDWKAEAVMFTTEDTASGKAAPVTFGKSCATVVSAVVQGSGGDRNVAKEYMSNVCDQKALAGWHKLRCTDLSTAIVDHAMSADSYANRQSLNSDKLCSNFWGKFVDAERKREAQEAIEKAARDKKAAEDAAIAKKKAEEEAAAAKVKAEAEAKAAAEKKAKEEAAKVQKDKEEKAKHEAEEAKARAADAAKKLAEKKAEAEKVAEQAKQKLAEAAEAEKEHLALKAQHEKAESQLKQATEAKVSAPAAVKAVEPAKAAVAKTEPVVAKKAAEPVKLVAKAEPVAKAAAKAEPVVAKKEEPKAAKVAPVKATKK